MKKKILWLAALIAAAGLIVGAYFLYGYLTEAYAPEAPETVSPHRAPDFTVLDANGKEVNLSDYFGKPLVVNFWATWCYYCTKEMPDFEDAYREHPEVQFLMINIADGQQETVASAKEYIEKMGYTFPVLFDTELDAYRTYGVSGLPFTFFIDEKGDLVTYCPGAMSRSMLEKGIALITED